MKKSWLAGAGALSLLGQALLFRELVATFSGSELFVVLGLGLALLSSGLGAFSCVGSTGKRVRGIFVLLALSFPVMTLFAASLRNFFEVPRGLILPPGMQALSIALVLFPFGFLSGRLFGEISALYIGEGGTASRAYAIDSAGAVAGGAAALLLSVGGASRGLCTVLFAFIALVLATLGPGISRKLAAALAFFPVFLSVPLLDGALLYIGRLEDPFLKETRETPYGRVSASFDGGQLAMFLNGCLLFESQSTSAEELVHIPALAAGSPGRALIMGGTAEGILREVLKHGPRTVDVVELDTALMETARSYLDDGRFDGLSKEGVSLTVGDGRRFLKKNGGYDLIVLSSSGPGSFADSRFYTSEFFDLCKKRLAPGGVLALRIKGSENLWTKLLWARNGSVLQTLCESFRFVTVTSSGMTYALASDSELPGADELCRRFEERVIEASVVSPQYITYMMTNDRGRTVEKALRNGRFARNGDLRPIAYPLTIILEAARHFPGHAATRDIPGKATRVSIWCVALIAVVFAASRFAAKVPARYILVFAAGLWGMSFEISFLVFHQLKNGALYRDIGLLTAIFMAGIPPGALFALKIFPGGKGVRVFAVTAAIFSSVSALLSLIDMGAIPVSLLLFLAGCLTGAAFGLAEAACPGDRDAALKRLYCLDLLGGAAGCILATLLLVPFVGIPGTLAIGGALMLFCL